MKLVDKLQNRLKESENNYRQLQEKINSQQNKSSMFKSNLSARGDQIQRVEERCEQMETMVNNYKSQLELCRKNLNKTMDDLEKEQVSHQTMQRQVRVLELEKVEKEQLLKELDDLKRQKRQLEIHLENLIQSPFVKKHEEAIISKEVVKELEDKYACSEQARL